MIHFVDNSAALACMVKGYSKVQDSVKIACDYWLRVASLKAFVFCDRVESKSNLSDDPSRLNVGGVMEQLGAQLIHPNLEYLDLGQPDRDPASWFGCRHRLGKLLLQLVANLPIPLQAQAKNVLLPPAPTLASPGETSLAVTTQGHKQTSD